MNVTTTYPKRTRVWVNGVFDILHLGHIRLFEFAKSQGNFLRVCIDSDNRVKILKGIDRPFNNQDVRKEILKSIRYIDEVSIFDTEEELIFMIKCYDPDVFVISDEYKDKKIIGKEYLRKIVYFNRIPEYSSTNYINLLKK